VRRCFFMEQLDRGQLRRADVVLQVQREVLQRSILREVLEAPVPGDPTRFGERLPHTGQPTFGGGLELAAACDVRIAADTARFGMPEVKLGIPSVIEAALLPTLIGWGRAREIMYLGENFTADEALQWGLVEHVVPVSALDAAVEAWIAKLLTSAPRAVRLQKKLIRRWEDLPLAAAVEAGIEAFAAAYASDEPRSIMREFLAARQARKKRR